MDMQRVRDLVARREELMNEVSKVDSEMVSLFSGAERPKRKWTRKTQPETQSGAPE